MVMVKSCMWLSWVIASGWWSMYYIHASRCWFRERWFVHYGALNTGFAPAGPHSEQCDLIARPILLCTNRNNIGANNGLLEQGEISHKTKQNTGKAQKLNVNNGTLQYITCVMYVQCHTYKGKLQHNLTGYFVLIPGKRNITGLQKWGELASPPKGVAPLHSNHYKTHLLQRGKETILSLHKRWLLFRLPWGLAKGLTFSLRG